MRERLTASFLLVTLALVVVVGVVRTYTLSNNLRERESEHVNDEAVTVAGLISQRIAAGLPVDRDFLAPFVHEHAHLRYRPKAGEVVEVSGPGYDDAGENLASTVPTAAEGTVTVSEDDDVLEGMLTGEPRALVALATLVLLTAALAGVLVARWLSAPFRQLAGAAAALARGRVVLDLPRTRIPEAAAIARSLQGSADQLRERIRREQEFAQHASHQLRSPLTGVRLRLEDITLRPELPEDVRATAERTIEALDHVDRVAGELVALQRETLVEGAAVPLSDLAGQVAQRWADALGDRDRGLTAAVEGELDQRYTPGPVEHVLDLILAPLLQHTRGDVRLELEGSAEGHLRVRVTAAAGAGVQTSDPYAEARSSCVALGGRWSGVRPSDGLEILLPRR